MSSDIPQLVAQLTLEEKAALCTGATTWTTVPVERLGIPSMFVSDGPHGVRKASKLADTSLPATCFPTASALASSWDTDLLTRLGQALGDECLALGVDVLLGPGNNMKRTPLCGRNFEYYSEDPFLSGEMATAWINGVQSSGVGTSLKHFAANNQETERMTIDARIDERTLREIYLAGFERAVKQAKPWTVMCSYNRINGTHGSEHPYLLTQVLKDEWGFEGLVVSDWGAVHQRVRALAAGLDLEMPGPQPQRVQRVIEAVQNGELPEWRLDDAVARILRIVFQAAQTPKGGGEIRVEAHHALARQVAAECMVLLKNEGNLLPLKHEKTLAVIGVSAQQAHFQGGGSSHINPNRVDVPLDELRKSAGDAVIRYAPGYTMEDTTDPALIDEAVAVARSAELALLYIALPPFKESEGYDRPDMQLSRQQEALIQAVCAAQPRCVVVLNSGSPVEMSGWIDRVPAVLQSWLMGQAGGGAIADVLFGRVNPSGHLAETYPLRLADTPAYLNFPGERGQVRYGEGIFIGYRYYDARQQPVLFPFGYGLSYTTFELSALTLNKSELPAGESLTVRLTVTNTGAVAGKAVVQVYVSDRQASLPRPPKELKGFVKVALEPGQSRPVEITLDPRAFAFYDPALARWVVEDGEFDILVGQSSAGPFLSAAVTACDNPRHFPPLTLDTTLGGWLDHPVGGTLLLEALRNFAKDQADFEQAIQQIEWARDIPLETALSFWAKDLPIPAEEAVGFLIAIAQAQQSPAA